jgi:hypothetical protein
MRLMSKVGRSAKNALTEFNATFNVKRRKAAALSPTNATQRYHATLTAGLINHA